ncbi:MAG: DUF5615 family PIN-like protein [Bifidobacteriaceae bacterium]|jgi:predicted nuclease of predicted toxin-antitoxin system|nr:DUF5615 family PIN-like protein [Bifidobacteriaceae bacterium]
MIRLLADENIDSDLIRGLQRRVASLDIARVQDVGLRTFDDAAILRWAADQGRALVSHDLKTIPAFAFDRWPEVCRCRECLPPPKLWRFPP